MLERSIPHAALETLDPFTHALADRNIRWRCRVGLGVEQIKFEVVNLRDMFLLVY